MSLEATVETSGLLLVSSSFRQERLAFGQETIASTVEIRPKMTLVYNGASNISMAWSVGEAPEA